MGAGGHKRIRRNRTGRLGRNRGSQRVDPSEPPTEDQLDCFDPDDDPEELLYWLQRQNSSQYVIRGDETRTNSSTATTQSAFSTTRSGLSIRARRTRVSLLCSPWLVDRSGVLPPPIATLLVAELTDDGEALIAKGAVADGKIKRQQIEQLANRIEELEETMDGASPWMREVTTHVRRLEAALEDITNESVDVCGDGEEYE